MKRFYTGCAMWAFDPWLGHFYPPGTPKRETLTEYGRRLTAVEGNTTFYGVPKTETLERWRDAVPRDFRFCLKLPRAITHDGALTDAVGAATDFAEHTARLGDRRGPCFAQLPPSFGPERLPELLRFLDAWPRDVELAVEVRHPRWFEPALAERLNAALHERELGRVVLDTRPIYDGPDDPQGVTRNRKPELPCYPYGTGDFGFVRFIGHPEGEARNGDHLDAWADVVTRWLGAGKRVYFFLHCPDDRFSPDFARAFHARLVARGAPVEPLPWATAPAADQMTLL